MKVVFLDFDGVLNNYGDLDAERAPGAGVFNQAAVERLNTIVARTGARVVISSSWRERYTLAGLRELLAASGFRGEVIGCTPLRAADRGLVEEAGDERCQEIQAWLDERAEGIERFVILDDLAIGGMASRQVRTDPETGLCDEHVGAVMALLG